MNFVREFDKGSKGRSTPEVADKLNAEFTGTDRKKWTWPNKTLRKNGQEVTSPRDIVDLGNLRASQRRETISLLLLSGLGKQIIQQVVHEWPKLKDGQQYKHRPWTKEAEKEVKPLKDFADRLEERVGWLVYQKYALS